MHAHPRARVCVCVPFGVVLNERCLRARVYISKDVVLLYSKPGIPLLRMLYEPFPNTESSFPLPSLPCRADNPGISFGQVSKVAGVMWKELPASEKER